MNAQRIIGILLLVGGLAALFYGLNASHSIADRVSDTFTGRFTEATTWYIIGGAAAAIGGAVAAVFCGSCRRG